MSYVSGVVSGKIKGLDKGVTGNAKLCFVMSTVSLFLFIPVMLLSCSNIQAAGHLTSNNRFIH